MEVLGSLVFAEGEGSLFGHVIGVMVDGKILTKGELQVSKRSPFRKGRKAARSAASGATGGFLSIGDGENVVFAPLNGLDELVSAEMHEYWDINPAIFHPCIGKDCPGCAVGHESRFKAYLPVVKKDGDTALWAFTISVYNQLEDLEDALEEGSLEGAVMKLSRRGTGLNTRYTVTGLGKFIDVSEVERFDFIDSLGPTTVEEITDLLEKNGYHVGGGTATEPAPTTESEDDAFEDVDEDDDWGDV